MAEHCITQREPEKAIKLYKEALIYTEKDGKAMLELARLYLNQDELDACQHQLVQLLQTDKENDAATVVRLKHVTDICSPCDVHVIPM